MSDILRYGEVLYISSEWTKSGAYTTRIIKYDSGIYVHVMLAGEVIEEKKIFDLKEGE